MSHSLTLTPFCSLAEAMGGGVLAVLAALCALATVGHCDDPEVHMDAVCSYCLYGYGFVWFYFMYIHVRMPVHLLYENIDTEH